MCLFTCRFGKVKHEQSVNFGLHSAEQLEDGLMLSSLRAIKCRENSASVQLWPGETRMSPRRNSVSVSSIPGHVPGPLETSEGCGSPQASQRNDNQNQDPSQDLSLFIAMNDFGVHLTECWRWLSGWHQQQILVRKSYCIPDSFHHTYLFRSFGWSLF